MNWRYISALTLFAAVFISLPHFIGVYMLNITGIIFMYMSLALSWDMLLRSGQLSFGTAGFFGIGSYAAALSHLTFYFYLDPIVTIIIGGIAAGVVALVIGLAVLHIRGYYFAISTLVISEILNIIARNLSKITGGPAGITLPNAIFDGDSQLTYYLILAVAFITIIISEIFQKTKIRFAIISIRNDEIVASQSGINIFKYLMLIFVVTSFIQGIVGGVYAHIYAFIMPEVNFSMEYMLLPMAIALFGGKYNTWGPVLGAFILVSVSEFLKLQIPYGHLIVYGIIIIISIILMPYGMVGLLKRKMVALRVKTFHPKQFFSRYIYQPFTNRFPNENLEDNMKEDQLKPSTISNRWSYLCLLLGAIFFVFGSGRWTVPLATWLSVIFMLRFIRTQKSLWGLIPAFIVFIIGYIISWQDLYLLTSFFVMIMYSVIVGIFIILPLLVDRLISPRCRGLVSTFVYPLAYVILTYFYELAIGGKFSLLSYTQNGNMTLVQIVSVTGVWGIEFLITWLASVVNFAWEQEFAWLKIRKVVGIYAGIIAVVLLYGGARLVLFQPEIKTVRIASITTPDIKTKFMELRTLHKVPLLKDNLRTLDNLTTRAAQFGAKIVFWQEDAAIVGKNDEAAFVTHGRELARKKKIYLMLGMTVLDTTLSQKAQNKVVLINPAGEVAWEYLKHHLVSGIEAPYYVSGQGKIPTLETPYGKVSAVICYDLDFPIFINQLKSDIDLLLVPSFDWKEITPIPTQIGIFRAIEHGYSLIRCTGEGLSIAVDPYGRTLAALTYFNTDEHIMISDVPIKGIKTIYSQIGDLFAWLCVAGFVAVFVLALWRRKEKLQDKTNALRIKTFHPWQFFIYKVIRRINFMNKISQKNFRKYFLVTIPIILVCGLVLGIYYYKNSNRPSWSAEGNAMFRAIGALDPDAKTRNPDNLAHMFVSKKFWKSPFASNLGLSLNYTSSKRSIDRFRLSGYYYLNARTKHIDSILKESVHKGIKQIVIMGAGYDSRAYRFGKDFPHIMFFEIDLPATQELKRERVIKVFGEVPKNVRYAPIDFNKQTLQDVLNKAGYDNKQKTLFIWEGVTMYIAEDAVNSTLKFIADNSAPGSLVVFDYILRPLLDNDYRYYQARINAVSLAKEGEPLTFGIDQGAVINFVNKHGLDVLSDLGPDELTKMFCIRSDGSVDGHMHGFLRVMYAAVPDPAKKDRIMRNPHAIKEPEKTPVGHTVTIPQDIQLHLDGFAKDLSSHNIERIMSHYSNDYLHDGTSRREMVFIWNFMINEFDFNKITECKIIVTHFEQKGNKAYYSGFIKSNIGLDLLESIVIIKAGSEWEIYGNQKRSINIELPGKNLSTADVIHSCI